MILFGKGCYTLHERSFKKNHNRGTLNKTKNQLKQHWNKHIVAYCFCSCWRQLCLDFMNLSLSELSSYSEDFNLIEIGLSSQSHFVVLMERFSYGCALGLRPHCPNRQLVLDCLSQNIRLLKNIQETMCQIKRRCFRHHNFGVVTWTFLRILSCRVVFQSKTNYSCRWDLYIKYAASLVLKNVRAHWKDYILEGILCRWIKLNDPIETEVSLSALKCWSFSSTYLYHRSNVCVQSWHTLQLPYPPLQHAASGGRPAKLFKPRPNSNPSCT